MRRIVFRLRRLWRRLREPADSAPFVQRLEAFLATPEGRAVTDWRLGLTMLDVAMSYVIEDIGDSGAADFEIKAKLDGFQVNVRDRTVSVWLNGVNRVCVQRWDEANQEHFCGEQRSAADLESTMVDALEWLRDAPLPMVRVEHAA
jgi:hypothetical protein